jgi:hypothetical protein
MLPIRFSTLKAFGRAPVFAESYLAGDEGDEETPAMEKGTALHALLFNTRPVTYYPEFRTDEKGKQVKGVRTGQYWEAFLAKQPPGAHILTEDGYRKATGMAASVRANRRAMQLLAGPGVVNEHTLLTKIAGRDVRATPDARGPEGLVDLKSCSHAGPRDFYFHSRRMCYPVQLGWYDRVGRACEVPFGPGRWLVAVESKAPYVCQVYRLAPDLVEEGDKLATLWFEGLRVHEQSGVFPGYGPDEMLLEAPYQDDGLDWGDSEDAEPEQAA